MTVASNNSAVSMTMEIKIKQEINVPPWSSSRTERITVTTDTFSARETL